MKTCTLIITIILVSMFHKVHPSNPDSEVVQKSSSSSDSNDQKKSAPLLVEYSDQERSTNSRRITMLTDIRMGRPVRMGVRGLQWPVFGIISYIPRRRVSVFERHFSNSRPDMVVPTNDETKNGDRSVIPNISFKGDTPLESSSGNNISSVGAGYFNKIKPPNSSNNARPYGNDGSDRRDQNIRPTSPNTYKPRDNVLFSIPPNPVFGRSESVSNFGLNRGNPQLPLNPPTTSSDSSHNRGRISFNGDENPSPSVFGPANVPNPGRRILPDANLFASIINDFGFKLVEAMNLETNFVLSPMSIFLALSMCYLGSDGSTKTQLEQELGLNSHLVHEQRLHQGVKDLISSILSQSSDYELYLANGLFFGKNVTVNKEFEENFRRFYVGELKNLDFENPQLSVPIINKWVSMNTRNMILSISDSIPSPLTRLLLLTAIYFKGIWKKQFPLNMTYDGRFYCSDGSNKMVPTMPMYNETFPFYRSEEHKTSFIKLPYEGDQVSVIIALPFSKNENPMPGMKDQILCSIRDALKDTQMNAVTIPKFRFEYTQSLKEALIKLGITHLFNPHTVNLGKMTPQNDVSVSAILQKAVIDINERGTSASASTVVKLVPLTLSNNKKFVVNHPFAFYIVHEPSGLVLFYGKIYDIGQRDVAPKNGGDSNP